MGKTPRKYNVPESDLLSLATDIAFRAFQLRAFARDLAGKLAMLPCYDPTVVPDENTVNEWSLYLQEISASLSSMLAVPSSSAMDASASAWKYAMGWGKFHDAKPALEEAQDVLFAIASQFSTAVKTFRNWSTATYDDGVRRRDWELIGLLVPLYTEMSQSVNQLADKLVSIMELP